jgi:SAM-dependent methyltransferase
VTTETAPNYLAPYLTAASRHGAGFSSLLWASPHTQAVRFAALTRMVGLNGKSLLDVGCGRADLLDFLLERKIKPAHYVGLEGVTALADAAEAKNHKDAMIVRADFVREPLRMFVAADVVYFSGSLNTLDPQTFYATIRSAFDAAAEMLVFKLPLLAAAGGDELPALASAQRGVVVLQDADRRRPPARRLPAWRHDVRPDQARGACVVQTGRIDVHAHLIPDLDDGCRTVGDSIACARELVAAGYTHAFCTPHVWPSYDIIKRDTVPKWTAQLQESLDEASVPLTVLPGGEMNLHEGTRDLSDDYLITYAMHGRYMLADIWASELPGFFEPTIKHLQSRGFTVDSRSPRAHARGAGQPEARRLLRGPGPAAARQPSVLR